MEALPSKINAALLEAQTNIGKATKDAVNPFFKSNYADLASVMEVVKKPLNDAGLSITQEIVVREIMAGEGVAKFVNLLLTVIRHSDGGSIVSSVVVPDSKKMQEWGSNVTYLKRYSLQAMLFVPTEDDDGNSATGAKKPKKAIAKPVQLPSVPVSF